MNIKLIKELLPILKMVKKDVYSKTWLLSPNLAKKD
jgi:hypothetical protein